MPGSASTPPARITVFTGKAELGQGLKTAVIQLAAEELMVKPEAVRLVTADTAQTAERGLHRRQPLDAGQRHRDPPRRGAGPDTVDRRGGEALAAAAGIAARRPTGR